MACPDLRSARGPRARFHLWGAGALLIVALVALAACGEATDNPEDCRPGEFFDEANELCTGCPAVVEPECGDSVGFIIDEDDRGCPIAVCEDCPDGQFFDDVRLACVGCDSVDDPPAICAD